MHIAAEPAVGSVAFLQLEYLVLWRLRLLPDYWVAYRWAGDCETIEKISHIEGTSRVAGSSAGINSGVQLFIPKH